MSTILELPSMGAAQAQKEVTFNQAMQIINARIRVLSRTVAAPPGDADEGDAYIVPSGASGVWASHEDDVVLWFNEGWLYFDPAEGPLIWVVDDSEYVKYVEGSPGGWESSGELATTADAVGYTPGNAGDWDVPPNDVAAAQDELASRVADLEGASPTDRSAVSNVSSSSGVVTLDYSLGDYFTLTLTENVTSWAISNPPGSGKGFTLMVQITQDSTPRTVAKPGTTAGGAALDVSTGSGDIDILAISSFNNGSTLRSSIAKDFS